MKRLSAFLSVFFVVILLAGASVAAQRGGHRGGQSGRTGPGAQGPHQQQRDPHGRQGPMEPQRPGRGEQQREHQRSRLHDCQRACSLAREEARQLQRYADRSRFEADTARQLGRQLRQHLGIMDREHARLAERLTPEERQQQRDRLDAMTRCQQRWQEALSGVGSELEKPAPDREQLRRRARAIEKEIKNYQKELHRLEEAVGD